MSKQIIVRIIDADSVKIKTIKKRYYYTLEGYEEDIYNFVKDLKPRQEVYIKVGNRYSHFRAYEDYEQDFIDYPQDYNTIQDVIWEDLKGNCNAPRYYIREYLGRY